MIRLTLILREVKTCYEWDHEQYKVNHLLCMDDMKLFAKGIDQIDSLVQTVCVQQGYRDGMWIDEVWCTGSQES